METFADRVQWVAREIVGTAEQWADRVGKSGGYVRTILSRAKDDAAYRPPPDALRELATAAGIDSRWLDTGEGSRPSSPSTRPPSRSRPRPTPPAGVPHDGSNPLMRGLLIAWKHSSCDPEDYEALEKVLRGGAAQLDASTDDQVAEVLVRWLGIARRLRLAGKPVTFATLAYEGVRPATFDEDQEGREAHEALGGTPPDAPVQASAILPDGRHATR